MAHCVASPWGSKANPASSSNSWLAAEMLVSFSIFSCRSATVSSSDTEYVRIFADVMFRTWTSWGKKEGPSTYVGNPLKFHQNLNTGVFIYKLHFVWVLSTSHQRNKKTTCPQKQFTLSCSMTASWEKQSLGVTSGSLPRSWGDHFNINCSHRSSFANNRLPKTSNMTKCIRMK